MNSLAVITEAYDPKQQISGLSTEIGYLHYLFVHVKYAFRHLHSRSFHCLTCKLFVQVLNEALQVCGVPESSCKEGGGGAGVSTLECGVMLLSAEAFPLEYSTV